MRRYIPLILIALAAGVASTMAAGAFFTGEEESALFAWFFALPMAIELLVGQPDTTVGTLALWSSVHALQVGLLLAIGEALRAMLARGQSFHFQKRLPE